MNALNQAHRDAGRGFSLANELTFMWHFWLVFGIVVRDIQSHDE
jgi:hypothetical protein